MQGEKVATSFLRSEATQEYVAAVADKSMVVGT